MLCYLIPCPQLSINSSITCSIAVRQGPLTMIISHNNFTGTLLDYNTEGYKAGHPIPPTWLIPMTLLILSTATTNMIVMITWARHHHLHTPHNLHIVSLAAADCLVAIVSMPVSALRMTGYQRLVQFLKVGCMLTLRDL